MIIVGRKLLEAFALKHADSRKALNVWINLVENSHWYTPQDIKSMYRSVDFLSDNRVIFNIRDNHYRLLVKVRYINGVVKVEWVVLMPSMIN
ncbi:type II toxin-antitoxin system HigB family toxin [Stenoxybacter acetivorans]|uniref:type II toxin-antitoxin system HigB family toxin n=1 Tax=Stenoxybacter acetivorans TaxID=422441 RepID=UPI001B809596|nr:type II toxin-antitoxin system HigB family toxin [Stenoxybacter acetivorans]